MACRRYLNEFPDTEIVEEIKKRHELRVAGLCDYCERAQTDLTCKFPERHRRDLPAGPKEPLQTWQYHLDRARGYKAVQSVEATRQETVRELAGATTARSPDARDNCSKCQAKRDEILKEIRGLAIQAFSASRDFALGAREDVIASKYRGIRQSFSKIILLGTEFSCEIRLAKAYRMVVGDLLIGDPS